MVEIELKTGGSLIISDGRLAFPADPKMEAVYQRLVDYWVVSAEEYIPDLDRWIADQLLKNFKGRLIREDPLEAIDTSKGVAY